MKLTSVARRHKYKLHAATCGLGAIIRDRANVGRDRLMLSPGRPRYHFDQKPMALTMLIVQ